ncbi:efflux RND transporter periplasmic adaptor subunit [Chitinimonas koreensis]|uniref:efflux RND transporter periplasmic adaptor subunit n=1 Tax=Chitinimonas koreensis TaxID=356302 RepID=UPI00042A92B0|nr:efflux RND transporter periplasmic adaptor subunit [Chitinimonas koreensis]QNM98340.1 efflux RND transporter periplasmic adaptor subunit [Chitinimonas koreensis]
MRINKKWLGLALVAVVIVVPLALRAKSAGAGREVELQPAALHEIRPTILASGLLAYRTEVKLTAEVTAKVKEILVKEGDDVQKGQVLLRLDPESYRNAIEREEAGQRQNQIGIERQRVALELRKKQFERTDKLFKAGMIDRSRFDEDRNQLQLAEVELKASEEAVRRAAAVLAEARDQLGKTEVRAPIAGRVVDLPIKVGETAIPSTMSLAGAQLMTVADTAATQAELKVDEGDIAKVALDQVVDLYPAAYPDRALKGTVEKIALAPTVENQARAYKVTVRLEVPAELRLRSGMSCRAEIFLSDGKQRLAVPVEALISEDKDGKQARHYVVLAREGVAARVEVGLGLSDDHWQEITRGVKAGDSVVTGPGRTLRELKDGDKLTPKPADKKDAADKKDQNAKQADKGQP